MEIQWFMVDTSRHSVPEYMRDIAYDPKLDQVFVSAAVAGDENVIFMLAASQGENVIQCETHVYLPVGFICRYLTDDKDIENYRQIESDIRKYMANVMADG